eukprot:scaffold14622_cov132-Isochrysis_galbana.AAC.1
MEDEEVLKSRPPAVDVPCRRRAATHCKPCVARDCNARLQPNHARRRTHILCTQSRSGSGALPSGLASANRALDVDRFFRSLLPSSRGAAALSSLEVCEVSSSDAAEVSLSSIRGARSSPPLRKIFTCPTTRAARGRGSGSGSTAESGIGAVTARAGTGLPLQHEPHKYATPAQISSKPRPSSTYAVVSRAGRPHSSPAEGVAGGPGWAEAAAAGRVRAEAEAGALAAAGSGVGAGYMGRCADPAGAPRCTPASPAPPTSKRPRRWCRLSRTTGSLQNRMPGGCRLVQT